MTSTDANVTAAPTSTAKLLLSGVGLIVGGFALPFISWGAAWLFFNQSYDALAIIFGSIGLGALCIALGALLLIGIAVGAGAKELREKARSRQAAPESGLPEA